jgi:glycine betaine catabolism B
VRLTLPIREVLPAIPRARIVRVDLQGHRFPYLAGQALFIGSHGSDRLRPYSIAAAPEDAEEQGQIELLVGVDLSGHAGPHLTLTPGSLVDIEGPVGRFTFPATPNADAFVFIAGGTGIAPLRAMLRHALREPRGRIGLVYSARTPSEFAYEDEWRQLAGEGRIELRQTVTRDYDEALGPSSGWAGKRGRIGRDELRSIVHTPATLYFVCGPPALVQDVPRLLDELGVPRERIRMEEWHAPERAEPATS